MYDVIIVGARVAGAPTAMLLARRGLKVLVVDRATFPSDTLSTHQVQLPGVARLARWGVLDAVLAAGTPVTRDVRFDQGDAVIAGRYPGYQGVEAMCSPRRTLLDRVLVDAARAAGAEVRENFAVERSSATTRLPASAAGRRARPQSPSRHVSSSARTVSTRWCHRGRCPRLPHRAAAVDRVLHLLGGRAGPGRQPGRNRRDIRTAGLRRQCLADQ
jgi:2-polyprenyl-6-methoxyphenol hydroxylase-like FAD-dependent oxidoreductase